MNYSIDKKLNFINYSCEEYSEFLEELFKIFTYYPDEISEELLKSKEFKEHGNNYGKYWKKLIWTFQLYSEKVFKNSLTHQASYREILENTAKVLNISFSEDLKKETIREIEYQIYYKVMYSYFSSMTTEELRKFTYREHECEMNREELIEHCADNWEIFDTLKAEQIISGVSLLNINNLMLRKVISSITIFLILRDFIENDLNYMFRMYIVEKCEKENTFCIKRFFEKLKIFLGNFVTRFPKNNITISIYSNLCLKSYKPVYIKEVLLYGSFYEEGLLDSVEETFKKRVMLCEFTCNELKEILNEIKKILTRKFLIKIAESFKNGEKEIIEKEIKTKIQTIIDKKINERI